MQTKTYSIEELLQDSTLLGPVTNLLLQRYDKLFHPITGDELKIKLEDILKYRLHIKPSNTIDEVDIKGLFNDIHSKPFIDTISNEISDMFLNLQEEEVFNSGSEYLTTINNKFYFDHALLN